MQRTVLVLHEQGYYVFRGALHPDVVRLGMSCIKRDTVHYEKMDVFIRDIVLAEVATRLELNQRPAYIKFRVSDNNNSADAAGFHRDIIHIQPDTYPFTPCFTCLTYFDTTTMELIPQSHHRLRYHPIELPWVYARRVRVTIEPGDILLFHSSLLHRGIFTERLPHRRLVQVFEVFLNPSIMHTVAHNILHVPGEERHSDRMIDLHKTNNICSSVVNTLGFINAATGYGDGQRMLTQCVRHKYMFFSSEGLRGRIKVVPGTYQSINKYVLNPEIPAPTLPDKCRTVYTYYTFHRQFIRYAVVLVLLPLLVLVCVATWIVYYVVSKRNKK